MTIKVGDQYVELDPMMAGAVYTVVDFFDGDVVARTDGGAVAMEPAKFEREFRPIEFRDVRVGQTWRYQSESTPSWLAQICIDPAGPHQSAPVPLPAVTPRIPSDAEVSALMASENDAYHQRQRQDVAAILRGWERADMNASQGSLRRLVTK